MKIQFLKFDNVPLPVFKEQKGKEFVLFGEKNDFPEYLLRLYNNSAKHNALITGKVDYISGGGWIVNSEDEIEKARINGMIQSVNRFGESLDEITMKVATDLIIFGGYYLQIIWTKATGEIAEILHVDFSRVRTNIDNTKFFVGDDWIKNGSTNSRPEFETFDAFDPKNPTGTQIFFFKEYRAGLKTYCLPDYRGAINYIELDVSISEYHLNTINNGMFSSKLINLNSGKVDIEEEARIEKQFNTKFAGSKNAGKFMLSFNDSKENEPSILDLSGTELDKHFDLLNKSVEQQILTGHKLTSGMLVGIKTEGQIGGRNELRIANEVFQNKYITPKQKKIEDIVNFLYSFNDVKGKLELKKQEVVEFEFGENIISANMTQDEIRKKIGLNPIQKEEDNQLQEFVNKFNSLPATLSQKVAENIPPELLLKMIGLKITSPTTTPATIPTEQPIDETGFGECCEHKEPITGKQGFKKKITDDMILKAFSGKGISKQKFKVLLSQKVGFSENPVVGKFAELNLTSLQQLILEELKKNPKLTKSELAEKANTNLFEIDDNLKALTEVGAIEEKTKVVRGEEVIERKVTDVGKVSIQNKPEIVKYKTLYSYEERPNVPAAASGSRPLCQRLYQSNLYFTGAEIQDISDQLGYSVFLLCGGWYRNPDTNKTTPYCRHFWQKNIVVEK